MKVYSILLNNLHQLKFQGLNVTITQHQPTVTSVPRSYGALSEQDTDVRSVSSTTCFLVWLSNFALQDCGLNCHEKCREHVPKACTKYKSVAGGGGAEGGEGIGGGGGGVVGGGQDSLGYGYNGQGQSAESRDSNILHKGYLYKRGALLKAWKLRWFQLDTIKHQLVYYDSKEDQFVRAAIDLSEIRNVTQPASLPPGAPKKADER